MRWRKFTGRAYRIWAVAGLLLIIGGYTHACVTGQSYGIRSSTFRGASR